MRNILFLCLFFLVGCATVTPYQAANDNKPGYRDVKLGEHRYRVSFQGNSQTPHDIVDVYMLYRASELTLAEGDDYFIVQDQSTDVKPTIEGSSGVSTGFGFGGRRGIGMIGMSTGGPSEVENGYTSNAFISTFKGEVPKENPKAYDAHELKRSLEPRIQRR